MKILVTGGRGFIGSHFVELALSKGHEIIDIDKMTYAANKELPWDSDKKYTLIEEDISELKHIPACDLIVNFAAESHVDNSINSSHVFVKSNVLGVHNLLELIRGKSEYDRPLFFHISTDEVYGDTIDGSFKETDALNPSNPYSATKAAAEHIIKSYNRTYGIDYLITRSSNNYGPRQYEEKLIPKSLSCLKSGKKIPLHGDGTYIRDWTYVKDNVLGLMFLIEKGVKNDTFNLASKNYKTNNEVVKIVCEWCNKDFNKSVKYVENRWGQDVRYSVNTDKINNLGWQPNYRDIIYNWTTNK